MLYLFTSQTQVFLTTEILSLGGSMKGSMRTPLSDQQPNRQLKLVQWMNSIRREVERQK
jgi:hypothetical protein